MRTILGARSARSLSPSEGVAGHLSKLAYMFLRARGDGARGCPFVWCCWFECPRCGAADGARSPAVELDGGLPEASLRCVTAAQVRVRRYFLASLACLLVCYKTLAGAFADAGTDERHRRNSSVQLSPKLVRALYRRPITTWTRTAAPRGVQPN